VALVELSILMVAPRRALEQSSVTRILFGAAATFALFLTSHPLLLIVLWCATVLPTWVSVRSTPGGTAAARVFAIAMSAALVCMAVGTVLLIIDPPWAAAAGWVGTAGGWLVAIAVMIRKGIFPFHSWYPALFSGATMSTALAATMPQVASYTAVRLLIGHVDHPEGVAAELVVLSQMALVTATYGAALAIVQRDLRSLIGTLAMSQSALVLGGLAGTLPMELNGAFCVWISSGLALTGIGLVSWALESRAGPIRLDTPQGRFWDAPALAAFFLLFGLAGIGLPGTLSFVADDLIVSGSLDEQFHAGLLVILATVLSGIAMMRGWFHVFGGPGDPDGTRHAILPRERVALTALLAALFLLGLWPDPLVRALDKATARLLGVDHAVELPAAHAHDLIAHGKTARLALDDFAHRPANHHLAQRLGSRIALAFVHASAHVGVEAQVVVPYPHLTVLQSGRLNRLKLKIFGRGRPLGAAGQDDALVVGHGVCPVVRDGRPGCWAREAKRI
jgi:NADH-quinone oxidoreductase subunit M